MITLTPVPLRGTVLLPPSKGQSIRSLAGKLLTANRATLTGAWPEDSTTVCDDVQVAHTFCEQLSEEFMQDFVSFQYGTMPRLKHKQLDCGDSALAMRVFAPIMALSPYIYCLRGRQYLVKRSMDCVVSGLRSMGCWCESLTNFPSMGIRGRTTVLGNGAHADLKEASPVLLVQGPLRGGEYHVDAGGSSQFISGLLMSLPLLKEDSVLYVENIESRPYIDMTITTMSSFDVHVRHNRYHEYFIPGRQHYAPNQIAIQGDWSLAANFMVAGALYGPVELSPLWKNSVTPSKAMLQVLDLCGAARQWRGVDTLRVWADGPLRGFDFDATDCPDIFPSLVALAVFCPGRSVIKGVNRLRYKENDRAHLLESVFTALGASVRTREDVMVIEGSPSLRGGVRIDCSSDNRVAMAAAIAASKAQAPVILQGKDSVNKSYPRFWEDLSSLRG